MGHPATESLPPAPTSHASGGAATSPYPGMRLGRYVLVLRLASGGMAEVWIASHSALSGFRRFVAVKTIRPDFVEEPGVRTLFLNEARIAARLRHSNVVDVLDLGEQDHVVYMVMPLVEGDSLAGIERRFTARHAGARLPVGILLRILVDTCRGMHAAHELTDDDGVSLGLVHRDMSPQNVLVGLDGIAKIADFGVAKALGRLVDETDGALRGKLAYLSPEQADKQRLDRRSDVFSTGIVLWEGLTGARLFRVDDGEHTLRRVRTLEVPDPRSRAPDLHAAIAEVAMCALARDPDRRFPTAEALADALEAAARKAQVATSSREVGSLVEELCGEDVERRRAAMRGRGPAPAPAVENGATTMRDSAAWIEPVAVTSKKRRTLATVGAGLVVGIAIAATALVLGARRAPAGAGRPATSVAPPPPSAAAAAAAAPRAPVPSPGAPVPSSEPSAVASPPAPPAVPHRSPKPGAKPHAPYSNPY